MSRRATVAGDSEQMNAHYNFVAKLDEFPIFYVILSLNKKIYYAIFFMKKLGKAKFIY
jgi:hypothetical protein